MPTKAELERENARLRRGSERLLKTRDIVIAHGRDVGWDRGEVNDLLDDLGLDQQPSYYRQTAILRVTINWDPEELPEGHEAPEITRVALFGPGQVGPWETTYEIEEWECHFEDWIEGVT